MIFRIFTASLVALVPLSAGAEELTGDALLRAISGRHFDCKMGDVALEWIVGDVETDAKTVPYSAIVRGKTVEAEYAVNEAGRLTSDGYGDERSVETHVNDSLRIARSDGRVMICKAR